MFGRRPKVPRSGKSSVRRITKGASSKLVSIRTSQDTWIAFPRNDDNDGWATLDGVDAVVAVSVNSETNPKFANVHLFDADDKRDRFNRLYEAKTKANHVIPHNRGVWISLYKEEASEPVSRVGAGAGLKTPPFAIVPLDDGREQAKQRPGFQGDSDDEIQPEASQEATAEIEKPLTIAEAKRRLAQTYGVDPTNVRIIVEG
jgi:hypothetical protein